MYCIWFLIKNLFFKSYDDALGQRIWTHHYNISPYEQKAFAGVIIHGVSNRFRRLNNKPSMESLSHGVPNWFWRVKSNVFIILPPLFMDYLNHYSSSMRKTLVWWTRLITQMKNRLRRIVSYNFNYNNLIRNKKI